MMNPGWKKWILILLIIQTFANVQNYQANCLMWDSIHDTNMRLNQMQQTQLEHHEQVNLLLERVLEFLKLKEEG